MLGYFVFWGHYQLQEMSSILSYKRAKLKENCKPLVHYLATNLWNREKMDWPKKLVPHSLNSYTFV